MPPIEVLDWEPDDDGGWWVKWRDPDNVDGLALEGVYHLEANNLDGLAEVRRAQGKKIADGNGVKLLRARGRVADGRPKGKSPQMPEEVAEWRDVYDEVVGESKERIELGVHGAAPPEALEMARRGMRVSKKHRREVKGDKGPFS